MAMRLEFRISNGVIARLVVDLLLLIELLTSMATFGELMLNMNFEIVPQHEMRNVRLEIRLEAVQQ